MAGLMFLSPKCSSAPLQLHRTVMGLFLLLLLQTDLPLWMLGGAFTPTPGLMAFCREIGVEILMILSPKRASAPLQTVKGLQGMNLPLWVQGRAFPSTLELMALYKEKGVMEYCQMSLLDRVHRGFILADNNLGLSLFLMPSLLI